MGKKMKLNGKARWIAILALKGMDLQGIDRVRTMNKAMDVLEKDFVDENGAIPNEKLANVDSYELVFENIQYDLLKNAVEKGNWKGAFSREIEELYEAVSNASDAEAPKKA